MINFLFVWFFAFWSFRAHYFMLFLQSTVLGFSAYTRLRFLPIHMSAMIDNKIA